MIKIIILATTLSSLPIIKTQVQQPDDLTQFRL